MSLKRLLLSGILCALLGLSVPGPRAAVGSYDAPQDSSPRALDLSNVKVQWFSKGQEDLPAWLNARFDVGPLGSIRGRVIETGLSADGNDDDGDPNGFDSQVFETDDGSLSGVSLGPDSCDFSTVYADTTAGQVVYQLRRGVAPGAWVLNAAQRTKAGFYLGRNRFPLSGRLAKGVLEISPTPGGGLGWDPSQAL